MKTLMCCRWRIGFCTPSKPRSSSESILWAKKLLMEAPLFSTIGGGDFRFFCVQFVQFIFSKEQKALLVFSNWISFLVCEENQSCVVKLETVKSGRHLIFFHLCYDTFGVLIRSLALYSVIHRK